MTSNSNSNRREVPYESFFERHYLGGRASHPSKLCEPEHLAAVDLPVDMLRSRNGTDRIRKLAEDGLISGPQADVALCAASRHVKLRRPTLCNLGTGTGKTAVCAAVALQAMDHTAKRRGVYFTQTPSLFGNFRGEMRRLSSSSETVDFAESSVEHCTDAFNGMALMTYSSLRNLGDVLKLADWLTAAGGGCVVFDECHALRSETSKRSALLRHLTTLLAAKNVLVFYCSATSVSKASEISYIDFELNLARLPPELVMTSLKSVGAYHAFGLSNAGVVAKVVNVRVGDDVKAMHDSAVGFFEELYEIADRHGVVGVADDVRNYVQRMMLMAKVEQCVGPIERLVRVEKKGVVVSMVSTGTGEDSKDIREVVRLMLVRLSRSSTVLQPKLDSLKEKYKKLRFPAGSGSPAGRLIELLSSSDSLELELRVGHVSNLPGNTDPETIIPKWNAGELDVVVLTKKGNTGFSFHGRPTDIVHIFLETCRPFTDVSSIAQMAGRTHRSGRERPPEFWEIRAPEFCIACVDESRMAAKRLATYAAVVCSDADGLTGALGAMVAGGRDLVDDKALDAALADMIDVGRLPPAKRRCLGFAAPRSAIDAEDRRSRRTDVYFYRSFVESPFPAAVESFQTFMDHLVQRRRTDHRDDDIIVPSATSVSVHPSSPQCKIYELDDGSRVAVGAVAHAITGEEMLDDFGKFVAKRFDIPVATTATPEKETPRRRAIGLLLAESPRVVEGGEGEGGENDA